MFFPTYIGQARLHSFHRPLFRRYQHGSLAKPGSHQVHCVMKHLRKKSVCFLSFEVQPQTLRTGCFYMNDVNFRLCYQYCGVRWFGHHSSTASSRELRKIDGAKIDCCEKSPMCRFGD